MTDLQIAQRVDARGLSCPLPIVRTKLAMDKLQPGDCLEVLATDPGSVKDFAAWASATKNELVASDVTDGVYRYVLRHK